MDASVQDVRPFEGNPFWLPSALTYVVFGVLALKLGALALSFAAGGALAAERCGPLSTVPYGVASPVVWAGAHVAAGAALVWAFVRQVRLGTPTRALFAVCVALVGLFAFLAAALAYEVGGFCASAAFCTGAACLAAGLATEGLPHPLLTPPARLFGLVKPPARKYE